MMQDQAHGMVNIENVSYHDFQPGAFYTPQPQIAPHQVLFSNPQPFPSPDYVNDGYIPTGESMGYFNTHRSLSEGYIHNPSNNDSFSSMSSGSSSCNASLGPATPPPAPHHYGPTKFPAVPITPSHVVPRQKAKRTATVRFHNVQHIESYQRLTYFRRPVRSAESESRSAMARAPANRAKSRSLIADIAKCPLPSKMHQYLQSIEQHLTSFRRKDNSMEKLVALIEGFGKSMEALNQRLDAMGSTVASIQSRLDHCQCGTVESSNAPCASHA